MNTQLTATDMDFVVSRISTPLRKLMQNHQVMIAGGFVRAVIAGEKPSDIDVFCQNRDTLDLVAIKLKDEYGPDAKKFHTGNAVTILAPPRIPVQFISRWLFPKLKDLVDSFDFTVCKAGVMWDQAAGAWTSCIDPSFYPDLAAKRLVYTSPERNEDAGGSILRVRKYLARGYNIQAESLAAVIARLVKGASEPGKPPLQLLDEQTISKVLCGLLREVDPLTIIDGVEAAHEDGHEQQDYA